jgi:hypothetical protein
MEETSSGAPVGVIVVVLILAVLGLLWLIRVALGFVAGLFSILVLVAIVAAVYMLLRGPRT